MHTRTSSAAPRLDDPRDDLTTVLVNAEVEDEDGTRHRLAPGDYARFFSTLAAAGSETSRNGIAHGVWLLDQHPRAARRCCGADPEALFPTAVEEIVRYASPVMHMRRNVARDTQLGGQVLDRRRAGRASGTGRPTTTTPRSTTRSAST